MDVRSAGEYASGHIPGAVNIPMEEIEARLDDLGANEKVILVCQSGKRAGMACALIEEARTGVSTLEGGMAAWVQAGLPLVSCSGTRWSLERQVRLVAGLLAFSGAVLASLIHPGWIILSGFVGLGLTFAGLSNLCPMASLLGKLPWNRPLTRKTPNRKEAARSEQGA